MIQRQTLGLLQRKPRAPVENLSIRRKPCARQFGNSAKPYFSPPTLRSTGCLRPRATCSNSRPLPIAGVFLNTRQFNKLGGKQPPTAVAGRGACQARGGAGPRAKHGVSAQPTPEKQGLACWAGWAESPCATIFKHVSNPLCRKRFGRSGWEKLGLARLTSRGVIQRGDTLRVRS